MMILEQWAHRWGVNPVALAELRQLLISPDVDAYTPQRPRALKSEGDVSNAVRIEASAKGCRLWRNNVGALVDERGRPVRYGLANDSKDVNKVIKSADLIGIRPLLITPGMVGGIVGQFVSREVKAPGWRYTATERERAQLAWASVVLALGGDAAFCSDIGTI